MRFPLEVVQALREAWPAEKPLGAKITGSDFAAGGWTPDEAVVVRARAAKTRLRLCDVVGRRNGAGREDSRGAGLPGAIRGKSPGKRFGITTGAIGLISDPRQAEDIIAGGKADFVALARAMLFNPRWPLHAAAALGEDIRYPPQYERSAPKAWPPAANAFK